MHEDSLVISSRTTNPILIILRCPRSSIAIKDLIWPILNKSSIRRHCAINIRIQLVWMNQLISVIEPRSVTVSLFQFSLLVDDRIVFIANDSFPF